MTRTPGRTGPRRPAVALVLGVALVAAVPGAALAVTPTPPALPTGVEDLQPYVGQLGCDPVAKPGVLAFQTLLMSTYRDTGSFGIVSDCGIGGQSEHKEGRAFDWAVSINNPHQVAEVEALTGWLTAYQGLNFASFARRFGIMYMIWNHRIWESYRPTLGWQPYTGTDPHTSHVHFSFGWNGAYEATSWWTGHVAPLDYGPYSTTRPPAPTPPPLPGPESPIDTKHDQEGGDGGVLGPATGVEQAVAGGRYRPYLFGAIFSSDATGVHEVHGSIGALYLGMGGSGSPLGFPTSDEGAVPGGRGNTFVGGSVLWSPSFGAHSVYGAIGVHYLAMGGPGGLLGMPTEEESGVPGGRGLTFAGGSVYWSPATGPHEVNGSIEMLYDAHGGPSAGQGLPLTDELTTPDQTGRFNHFDGGVSIYWAPASGVHSVQGAIRAEWAATGWELGPAGYPITDELPTGDGGRFNDFSKGTSVLWSPTTGAHEVQGVIRLAWLSLGGVGSALGYPVSDEVAIPGGRASGFEHGQISWDATSGAITVTPS